MPPVRLLVFNETRNANHRVLFRLIGAKSNRAAVGARVTVYTSQMTQIDEVRAEGVPTQRVTRASISGWAATP